MKNLTLQITADNFEKILKNKQTVESRIIYPTNIKKYIENGTPYLLSVENFETNKTDLEPRDYDTLTLINGRQKDAPRMIIEVEEIHLEPDMKDGDWIYYEEDGVEYFFFRIFYTLGKVLQSENCEKFA